MNYLFFKVANVAQIKSDHFNDCEEDHPGYEQSLVVPGKIIELGIKQSRDVSMWGRYENILFTLSPKDFPQCSSLWLDILQNA